MALTVSPMVGSVGTTFTAKVHLEPDPDVREWCVHWASDNEEGTHCTPIEGVGAALTRFYRFTPKYAEDYLVYTYTSTQSTPVSARSIPVTIIIK